MPEFEGLIKRHGKIRLLLEMVDFHGWKEARSGFVDHRQPLDGSKMIEVVKE